MKLSGLEALSLLLALTLERCPCCCLAVMTPLHVATVFVHHQLVLSLLQDGANCNVIDMYGNTALMYAAAAGDVGLVDALLGQGADPRAGQLRPLAAASRNGHIVVVDRLLQGGHPGLNDTSGPLGRPRWTRWCTPPRAATWMW